MSDLEIPTVEGDVDEFRRLLAEQHPETGRPKEKYTMDQVMEANRYEDRMRLISLLEVVPGGPPEKRRRILMTLHDVMKCHANKGPKSLGGGKLVGKERTKKGLVRRLKDYLNLRILRSVKKNKEGEEVLDDKGNPQYMSIASLLALANLVISLLDILPQPRFTASGLILAKRDIRKHVKLLVEYYGLKKHERRKTTLYPEDIKGLIEHIFEEYHDRIDIAVQMAAMILVFMYTGARPGSVLKTRHYPYLYSVWRDIKFFPARDAEGQTVGFDVHVTLRSFKGYHSLEDMRITFKVQSTISSQYAVLDLGTYLIAHAIGQGAFGEKTLEDLLRTEKASFTVDPGFMDVPLFRARASRNVLSSDPMTDASANAQLRAIMQSYGIGSFTGFSDTLYALRRGFATRVAQHLSAGIAKFHLGQHANSTVMESTYYQGHSDENLTEGVVGEKERQVKVITPLSFTRARNEGTPPVRVSLKEALEVHPEYRHLYTKRVILKNCLAFGTTRWKTIAPFAKMKKISSYSNADLPGFISELDLQLRQIVERIKRGKYSDEALLAEEAHNEASWKTIAERRDKNAKPSELAIKLQERVLESERNLYQQADASRLRKGSDRIVIEVTADFLEQNEGEDEDEDEDDEDGGEAGEEKEDDHPEEEEEEIEEEAGLNSSENEGDRFVAQGDDQAEALTAEEEMMHIREIEEQHKEYQGEDGDEGFDTEPFDLPTDAASQKLTIMKSLVSLLTEKSKAEASGTKGKLCQECQLDSTAGAKEKAQYWVQGVKLTRHKIQYHSDFPTAWRWISSHIHDGRWLCPFRDGEGGEQADYNEEPCPWSCSKGAVKNAACSHLIKYHRAALSDNILTYTDPERRKEAKVEIANALENVGIRKIEKAPEGRRWNDNFESYLVPGVFGVLDHTDPIMAEWGLGASLDGTFDVDYDDGEIPAGLLDEYGWFINE
ncbi:hypothetical protein IAU59_006834 [Kwoniella sp. CBS 9459]